MAARVITVTSGKGGVGKTTITANLAATLASLGNRVVAVDADIGLRNLDVVMGLENRIVYDLVDVIEGRCRLRQALIREKRLPDHLALLPAAQTRDKSVVSPDDMVRLCDELRSEVDYILIDSPAGIEQGFRNALAPADEFLLVTTPEIPSVRDADRVIGLAEASGKPSPRLIINRFQLSRVRKGEMLDVTDIMELLAIRLVGIIPEDDGIIVSVNKGVPVVYDGRIPAATAFRNTARRLLGEEIPFMPLRESKGFLGRFRRIVG